MGCGERWRRPHRPYEGSQREFLEGRLGAQVLSSSPLRGVATCRTCPYRQQPPVLIAPTRGRNTKPSSPTSPSAPVLIAPTRGRNSDGGCISSPGGRCPHRPYEGSQHEIRGSSSWPTRVLIALTRGRNRARASAGVRSGRRPHRPYEGSQLSVTTRAGELETTVLIAPTRGRNFRIGVVGSSAPSSPHRPYEGSQQLTRDALRARVPASSSPLRGVATGMGALRRCAPRVLIAPTRGRNTIAVPSAMSHGSPHRPCEGSQHLAGLDRARRRPVSSSPLRGVATECHAWSQREQEPVLIAPARGCNVP